VKVVYANPATNVAHTGSTPSPYLPLNGLDGAISTTSDHVALTKGVYSFAPGAANDWMTLRLRVDGARRGQLRRLRRSVHRRGRELRRYLRLRPRRLRRHVRQRVRRFRRR
jgi:uridine kinase